MTPEELESAVDAVVELLRPHTGTADWSVPAGDLEWSCWTTAAHVVHDLTAYALQLAARSAEPYPPVDLLVRTGVPPAGVLPVVESAGRLLARTVSATPGGARARHWGPTDAAGFAALGCTEVLVHGYDVARGLDLGWRPPAALAVGVLDRLFPGAPDGDPGEVLLWCTGRLPLGDRPRRTSWVPSAAR